MLNQIIQQTLLLQPRLILQLSIQVSMKQRFERLQQRKLRHQKASPSIHALRHNWQSELRCSMKALSIGLPVRCLPWAHSCLKVIQSVLLAKMSAEVHSRSVMQLSLIRTMDLSGHRCVNLSQMERTNSSSSTPSSLNMLRWALNTDIPLFARMHLLCGKRSSATLQMVLKQLSMNSSRQRFKSGASVHLSYFCFHMDMKAKGPITPLHVSSDILRSVLSRT